MKTIQFGGNTLNVSDVYPYRYSNGKVVLRVTCDESVTEEATMKLLQDNTEDIAYYEDDELKIVYEGYDSGEYTSAYQNGIYSCEVTKTDAVVAQVAQNTANIEFLMLMEEE